MPNSNSEELSSLQKIMDDEDTVKTEETQESDVIYKLEDVPPWYLSLLLGLQHYLTMFSGAVAIPFIITPSLCMAPNSPNRGDIISTTLFASGIASFLQATFGVRLPIIQGPSLTFLVPVLAILNLPQWKCPPMEEIRSMNQTEAAELWMSRMREVQGAIIVGAIIEGIVGLTGLIGFLMRWITPLAIAPTITLIGMSLFKQAAKEAAGNWYISSLTMILLILFSQYLANVTIPIISYSKGKGWRVSRIAFFKLFPVILAILLMWGFHAILTAANVFPDDQVGRNLTDSTVEETPWVRVPYPGQWGMPTFNIGPALGVVAGVLATSVESVGDYYACAKLAGAPPPPTHAVNRGIFAEGLGSMLSGFCGTGSALTSFSQNVGAIAITKVGSRRVIQYSSVILICFGMISKFGVLFIEIPSAIMGGIFFIMFAFITGVGLSNLQYINLNSSRNLFILGFSIFMGLSIPEYIQGHPEMIQTGNPTCDQILLVLLKTSMFIGGFLGCLLDNTIPASKAERGLEKWTAETRPGDIEAESKSPYNIPFLMPFIRKIKCFRYVPISPTFQNSNINLNCFGRKNEKSFDVVEMKPPLNVAS